MHDSETSLDTQHNETLKAREVFKELEELFPEMTLVHSNHGSMLYRLQRGDRRWKRLEMVSRL